jgi:polyhydroxyalkanoate synthesis regulator protein
MSDTKKRTFVKYRNRKLHESGSASPYTTMEELLSIVAAGEDVEIIDDQTGEDLTAFTLSRLVYDRCRQDKDAYPVKELSRLIRTNPPTPTKKEAA